MKALNKALKYFDGNQRRFSEAIGVSPAFVSQMLKGIRPVPARIAIEIEKVTGGIVTKKELLPEIFE